MSVKAVYSAVDKIMDVEKGEEDEEDDLSRQKGCLTWSVRSRVVGFLEAEVEWAMEESHEMTIVFLCPQRVVSMSRDEQLQCWAMKYNPLYWGTVVGTAWCALSGKWVHALFGQGGPVREDELPAEHEARVTFIYTTDGPIALSACLTLAWLAVLAANGDFGDNAVTTGNLTDLLVDVCYVGGNVLFLHALKNRHVLLIRCAVVSNAGFAAGLLVLLLLGGVDSRFYQGEIYAWQRRATWLLRFIVVVFLAAAAYVYAALWNVHGPVRLVGPSSRDCTVALVQYSAMASSALLVWLMLFALFADGDAPYIWDAFTRRRLL